MKKTKKERRLAVLKDALLQLNKKVMIASPGTVCYMEEISALRWEGSLEVFDLQKFIKENFKNKKQGFCSVCARGALLISTVYKENSFSALDLYNSAGAFNEESIPDKRLIKLFSAKQIALMENAFEVEEIDPDFDDFALNGINYELLGEKLSIKSVKFGLKYKSADDRLIAIFKNAIKNGGIFKP